MTIFCHLACISGVMCFREGFDIKDAVQGQESPRQPEISPEGVSHLSQSKLLPLLMASARTASSKGTIRMGCTVKAVEQGSDSVTVTIQDKAVRGKYLSSLF